MARLIPREADKIVAPALGEGGLADMEGGSARLVQSASGGQFCIKPAQLGFGILVGNKAAREPGFSVCQLKIAAAYLESPVGGEGSRCTVAAYACHHFIGAFASLAGLGLQGNPFSETFLRPHRHGRIW